MKNFKTFIQASIGSWQDRAPKSYEAAICGSISGGFAAAITTPLDVIKTRLMLGTVSYSYSYYICFTLLCTIKQQFSYRMRKVFDTQDQLIHFNVY